MEYSDKRRHQALSPRSLPLVAAHDCAATMMMCAPFSRRWRRMRLTLIIACLLIPLILMKDRILGAIHEDSGEQLHQSRVRRNIAQQALIIDNVHIPDDDLHYPHANDNHDPQGDLEESQANENHVHHEEHEGDEHHVHHEDHEEPQGDEDHDDHEGDENHVHHEDHEEPQGDEDHDDHEGDENHVHHEDHEEPQGDENHEDHEGDENDVHNENHEEPQSDEHHDHHEDREGEENHVHHENDEEPQGEEKPIHYEDREGDENHVHHEELKEPQGDENHVNHEDHKEPQGDEDHDHQQDHENPQGDENQVHHENHEEPQVDENHDHHEDHEEHQGDENHDDQQDQENPQEGANHVHHENHDEVLQGNENHIHHEDHEEPQGDENHVHLEDHKEPQGDENHDHQQDHENPQGDENQVHHENHEEPQVDENHDHHEDHEEHQGDENHEDQQDHENPQEGANHVHHENHDEVLQGNENHIHHEDHEEPQGDENHVHLEDHKEPQGDQNHDHQQDHENPQGDENQVHHEDHEAPRGNENHEDQKEPHGDEDNVRHEHLGEPHHKHHGDQAGQDGHSPQKTEVHAPVANRAAGAHKEESPPAAASAIPDSQPRGAADHSHHQQHQPGPHAALVAPRNKQVKVLLVAYHRGGSSLFGQLFNVNRKSFYWFEPFTVHFRKLVNTMPWKLKAAEGYHRNYKEKHHVAVKLQEVQDQVQVDTRKIFQCDFANIREELLRRGTLFHHIQDNPRRLHYQECARELTMPIGKCLPVLGAECKDADIVAVKTTRMSVDFASRTVQQDTHVIYMTRDPRGLLWSLLKKPGFDKTDLADHAKRLCANMLEDCQSIHTLTRQKPDQYMMVKYDDLATQPETVTWRVYAFLGKDAPGNVKAWLRMQTNPKTADERLRAIRHSQTIANEWRTKWKPSQLAIINAACRDTLKGFGFE